MVEQIAVPRLTYLVRVAVAVVISKVAMQLLLLVAGVPAPCLEVSLESGVGPLAAC